MNVEVYEFHRVSESKIKNVVVLAKTKEEVAAVKKFLAAQYDENAALRVDIAEAHNSLPLYIRVSPVDNFFSVCGAYDQPYVEDYVGNRVPFVTVIFKEFLALVDATIAETVNGLKVGDRVWHDACDPEGYAIVREIVDYNNVLLTFINTKSYAEKERLPEVNKVGLSVPATDCKKSVFVPKFKVGDYIVASSEEGSPRIRKVTGIRTATDSYVVVENDSLDNVKGSAFELHISYVDDFYKPLGVPSVQASPLAEPVFDVVLVRHYDTPAEAATPMSRRDTAKGAVAFAKSLYANAVVIYLNGTYYATVVNKKAPSVNPSEVDA